MQFKPRQRRHRLDRGLVLLVSPLARLDLLFAGVPTPYGMGS
jgi:hypothetical protein